MPDACPKCGTGKSGESCPKCGLVFAKFNPAAIKDTPSIILRDLWRHTEQHWEEKAAHALFIERALAASQAGYAAACYRARGDDPIAQTGLKNLTCRLEQSLLLQKSNPPRNKHPFRYAFAFALLLLGAAVAFLLLR